MKVLVTGGAGFIGVNLVSRLLQDGHGVTVLDNLSTGRRNNVDRLEKFFRFRFIQGDVRSEASFACADKEREIYHLACPASPMAYQADPIGTFYTAIMGTKNAIGAALALDAPILLASTSEVYGTPAIHPQTEEYWGHVNPVGIRSCYDEGKRAAETLAFDHHRQHGTQIRVARIFNTYGPYMQPDDGRVVSNFIMQALRGKDLTVYGDGQQTRSLCYVSDLVDGLVRMMDGHETGPINMGNPHEITMLGLAEMVLEIVGGKSHVAFAPLPQDDPTRRCPDITKARQMEWSPTVELQEGLERTVAYFRKNLGR